MKKEKFRIKRRFANSSELTDTKVKSQQDGLIFERNLHRIHEKKNNKYRIMFSGVKTQQFDSSRAVRP
jgi:hypothetical protein